MQNVCTLKVPDPIPSVNDHLDIRIKSIRKANNGKVRAYADVEIHFGNGAGTLTVLGLSVIHADGKAPWVGFPQRKGKTNWFPIVTAEGRLLELICNAVLDAYKEASE